MRTLWLVGLAAGCFGDDSVDLSRLEAALSASASLGQSATLAMAATGTASLCTTVTAPCTSYPCDGAVTIGYGADCPLPLGGVASGSVNVSGSFSSADAATLASVFVSASAGGRPVAVVKATSLTVRRAAGDVTVTYTGQNVTLQSGSLVAQSSWTVQSMNGRYTIDGADQGVSSGVAQLSITGAVVDPACAKNPTAGSALLQEVALTNLQQTNVRFHAACDGTADVTTTTGGSKKVKLHFP
jgi:hypothetical protein